MRQKTFAFDDDFVLTENAVHDASGDTIIGIS